MTFKPTASSWVRRSRAGPPPDLRQRWQPGRRDAKQSQPALILPGRRDAGSGRLQDLPRAQGRSQDREIPVVLVTSKKADSDKFWGKKQGADEHVGKPYTKEQVGDLIHRYVR